MDRSDDATDIHRTVAGRDDHDHTRDAVTRDETLTSKDTSYSPGSERETEIAQDQDPADSEAPEAASDQVALRPGTGGPDDVGDVRVDPADLNMPHGDTVH